MWLLTLFGCGEEHTLSTQVDTSNMVEIATEDTTYRMGYPDLDPGPYNNHWKNTQSLSMTSPYRHSTWIKPKSLLKITLRC